MEYLVKNHEVSKIYPIFHVALPLIITEVPSIKKLKINKYSLIIGSLLSDIIDKPLFLLGFGNGRFFSHNLLFVVISFLIVHFFSKKNKSISFPFFIGLIFHLILDLPNVPFFYPFINYDFGVVEEPLLFWIRQLWTEPLVMITEGFGVLFIIYILIKNKLYYIDLISDYLKGVNQTIIKSSKEVEISV
ncbi:MAG: metal-dependent hydrolase [Promethearchaeota archaeon]